jgi:multidrug efflux pump
VFYVLMRKLAGNRPLAHHGAVHAPVAPAHGGGGASVQALPAAPRHPIE